jgi:Na+/H+ antiporter NhaA
MPPIVLGIIIGLVVGEICGVFTVSIFAARRIRILELKLADARRVIGSIFENELGQ